MNEGEILLLKCTYNRVTLPFNSTVGSVKQQHTVDLQCVEYYAES